MHASKGCGMGSRYNLARDHWKPQSQHDCRTLYVACNRARNHLVSLVPWKNLPPSWTKIFEQTLMREPAKKFKAN
jgi:hypothetical protein